MLLCFFVCAVVVCLLGEVYKLRVAVAHVTN